MLFASTYVTSHLVVFLAFDPTRESDLHETQISFPIAANKLPGRSVKQRI